jgi:type IV pilus assembly protein PilY1
MNPKRGDHMAMKKCMLLGIICFILCFPSVILSEDTELFGGATINVPPNVLIIFDTSGSMAWEAPVIAASTPTYNPSYTYSGTYLKKYVYYKSGSSWNNTFRDIGTDGTVESTEIACDDARYALNTYGHWQGYIYTSGTRDCGGSTLRNLRTGNYLNYCSTYSVTTQVKLTLAKNTIKNLIETTNGVRFGIMRFGNNRGRTDSQEQGGRLVAPIKDRTTTAEKEVLKTQIDALTADGSTPLAETLAEAGLYFARKPSWWNSGVDYGIPSTYGGTEHAIQWRCQKNYIIIMTDGASTRDRDKIGTTTYLNGKIIGDYDKDVPSKHSSEYTYKVDSTEYDYDDNGSDYLDDVAKFLYDEDILNSDVVDASGVKTFNDTADNSKFAKQNIITYTIGFDTDQPLLTRAADSSHGQGHYYTTASNISLSDIFEEIIGDILETNAQFVAPVVPVNRMNRTYADNGLYMGIFSPESSTPGLWRGNIKKFGFNREGEIIQRDGVTPATDENGAILPGAHSAWVEVQGLEGMTVDKGGAGAVLLNQTSRTFKTYNPNASTADKNITMTTTDLNSSPLDTNFPISYTDLGLTSVTERDDLMKFVTASGIYSPLSTATDKRPREWILGDIVHSQPAILYDRTNNRNVIFVGANDGFMHCFVDNDKGIPSGEFLNVLSDDEVSEAWAFIPWDILPNLKYLPPELATDHITGDSNHDFYVDGSPTVYRTGGNTYLAFGLRRGGKNIFTGTELDNQYFILNISTYTSPTFATSIPKNILGSEQLGQSWCAPRFCTIRTGNGTNDKADVLLLTGGYDTNQDNANPGASDTKGRALFAVNAADGTFNSHVNFNHNNYGKMKYCMVDLKSYDDDDDGCDDVIYTPSVGGDLFVFESKKHMTGTTYTYDGVWSHRLLFQAQNRGSTSKLRKFFYAPGIAQEVWGDWVYIGSGDREHPSDLTGDETSPSIPTYNRLYAIKNTCPQTWSDDTPITDSNLIDVTDDLLQSSAATDAQKAALLSQLEAGSGWFFDLDHAGEKIVSSPLVYNKVVYFSTFTPTSSGISSTDDYCSSGTGAGTGRLYAVDYKTGNAVFADFDGDSSTLTKDDRSVNLGSGIPPQPSLVITEKGAFIVTGSDIRDTREKRSMTRYYWLKQQ